LNKQNDIQKIFKDKLNQQEFDIQEDWLNDMSSKLDDLNDEPKDRKGVLYLLMGLALLISIIGGWFIIEKNQITKENPIVKNTQSSDEVDLYKTEEIPKKNSTKNIHLNEYNENENTQNNNQSNDKIQGNTKKIVDHKLNNTENSDLNTNSITNKKGRVIKKTTLKSLKNSKTVNANASQETVAENYTLKNKQNTSSSINNKNNGIAEVNNNNNNNNSIENNKTDDVNSQENKYIVKPNLSTISNSENQIDNNLNEGKVVNTNILTSSSIFSEETKSAFIEQNTNPISIENGDEEKTKTSTSTINQNGENSFENIDKSSVKTESEIKLQNNINDNNLEIELNNKEKSEIPTTPSTNILPNKENTTNLEEEVVVEELLNDTIVENDIKNPKEKKNLGISISLTAGPSFLFRNFESENNKRKQEESNIISWNASLEINKTFKNNIIIGTGINLINYGEKIDYSPISVISKDSSYSYQNVTYSDFTLNREKGIYTFDTTKSNYTKVDTTLIVQDIESQDNSVQAKNGETNFMYIEIPLMFGYKILDTKTFDIDIKTGASIGFLTQNKAYYIDQKNILQKATSNTIIYNYILSANLKYEVAKNINISLSPHFKYNLNNLSTITATKRNYSTFGINGGIILDF